MLKIYRENRGSFFDKWKNAAYSLAASVLLSYLAFYAPNPIFELLNIFVWVITAYFIFKNHFEYINSVDLNSDLEYIKLRSSGLVSLVIGSFITVYFWLFSSGPLNFGMGLLGFGFSVSGAFMLSRTERRRGVFILR